MKYLSSRNILPLSSLFTPQVVRYPLTKPFFCKTHFSFITSFLVLFVIIISFKCIFFSFSFNFSLLFDANIWIPCGNTLHRLGPRSIQSFLFIFSGLLMMASITLHETLPKEEALESTGKIYFSTLENTTDKKIK